jgi:hypothetical protein
MRTQPTKSPSESCVGCQESPRSTQSKQLAFAVSAISALNESLRPLLRLIRPRRALLPRPSLRSETTAPRVRLPA